MATMAGGTLNLGAAAVARGAATGGFHRAGGGTKGNAVAAMTGGEPGAGATVATGVMAGKGVVAGGGAAGAAAAAWEGGA
jgi:hypothetical protein